MSKARELLLMARDAKPHGESELPKPSDIFDTDTSISAEYMDRAVGWTAQREQRERAKITKPTAEWNQKDILKFVAHLYYETTGQSFKYTWGADYAAIRDIASRLNVQFRQTECPNDMMRGYVAYVFEKHVTPHIGRGKKWWTGLLAQPQFIIDYAQHRQRQAVEQQVEIPAVPPIPARIVEEIAPVASDGVTIAQLDAAFKINSKYFVTHYGAVLHANYLVVAKRMTVADALATVKKAIDKAQSNDDVMAATRKFGPYPTWLPLTDFSSLGVAWLTGIEVCADNRLLGFLKPTE